MKVNSEIIIVNNESPKILLTPKNRHFLKLDRRKSSEYCKNSDISSGNPNRHFWECWRKREIKIVATATLWLILVNELLQNFSKCIQTASVMFVRD